MRIWSVHPKYLDTKGLGGCWRETLLAKAVFEGKTKGYTKHPQLNRFRETSDPVKYISTYLSVVHAEAKNRGFNYDGSKVGEVADVKPIAVTKGQLEYEWHHLVNKLKKRSPEWLAKIPPADLPDTHPIFEVVEGGIADWEVVQAPQPTGKSKKRKSKPANADAGDQNAVEVEDDKSDVIKDSANLQQDDPAKLKRPTRGSIKRSEVVRDPKVRSASSTSSVNKSEVVGDRKARSTSASNAPSMPATAARAQKSDTISEKPVKRRRENSTHVVETEQPSRRDKRGTSSRHAVEPSEQASRGKKTRASVRGAK
jgi:Pyrimidine dimer DNA glycosylase